MKKIIPFLSIISIFGIIYSQWLYPTMTPYPQNPGTAMGYGHPDAKNLYTPWDYGKLYVLFGHTYSSGEGLEFYSFDCSTKVWERLPPLPTYYYAYYGTSICYFAKDNLELIFCILGLKDGLVPRSKNDEFWLYDIKGRRWYNISAIETLPGREPIGFGSDIVTGELYTESVGGGISIYEYVKIYISKGVVNPQDTAKEFFVYYFPLPPYTDPISPGDDTIGILIRRSYFRRLQDFPHGCNSRMTFNPSFRVTEETFRKEIYAISGFPEDKRILRYDISTNNWHFLTNYPGGDFSHPSIGMFGVISNRQISPFPYSSIFFVLRGMTEKK